MGVYFADTGTTGSREGVPNSKTWCMFHMVFLVVLTQHPMHRSLCVGCWGRFGSPCGPKIVRGRPMLRRLRAGLGDPGGGGPPHGPTQRRHFRPFARRRRENLVARAMGATKPYKFLGSGALDVTKPYKFMGFGALDVTKL